MAACKYCGTKIVWLQDGRKKVPAEEDGAKHECEEFKKVTKSFKKLDPSAMDPELIKQYEQGINKNVRKNIKKKK